MQKNNMGSIRPQALLLRNGSLSYLIEVAWFGSWLCPMEIVLSIQHWEIPSFTKQASASGEWFHWYDRLKESSTLNAFFEVPLCKRCIPSSTATLHMSKDPAPPNWRLKTGPRHKCWTPMVKIAIGFLPNFALGVTAVTLQSRRHHVTWVTSILSVHHEALHFEKMPPENH